MLVRYENGVSLPPLDRLIALAELYDVTPTALLARNAAAVPLLAALLGASDDEL
jgi:transcriptional regulator with XRE-family HTH domain